MEELTTVPRSFSLLPRHHPLDLWHHVRGASFAPSPHLHKCSRAHRAQCNALGKEYIATAIITYCHILSEKNALADVSQSLWLVMACPNTAQAAKLQFIRRLASYSLESTRKIQYTMTMWLKW